MRRLGAKVFGLLLLAALAGGGIAPGAAAQAGPGAGRMFDPATVTTLEGTVSAIERPASPGGMGTGVHLMVRSGDQTVAVHLGPSWFIDQQLPRLQVGDVVSVRGSRVTIDGQPAVVASSLTVGGQTVVLRDADGRPVWAGQRPNRP